jgi:aminoglycoside phosphotransferase
VRTGRDALRRRFAEHDWQPVTHGESGAEVWQLIGSPELYLKVGDVSGEVDRLAWLAEHGLPVPEIVDAGDWCDPDATGWLLTRAVPGRPASDPWPPAQRDGVVAALVDVAARLHALPVTECPFARDLAVTVPCAHAAAAENAIDLDDLDAERRGWTAARLVAELDATVPADEDLVVCHGDFCLPNVILEPRTLRVNGLVDAGRLGVADRWADLALITRSLADERNDQFGAERAARFLTAYGVREPDAAKLAFYRLLDEFF